MNYKDQKMVFLEPTELVDEVRSVIEKLGVKKEEYIQEDKVIFIYKKAVPVKQLFALYAINKICSIAINK